MGKKKIYIYEIGLHGVPKEVNPQNLRQCIFNNLRAKNPSPSLFLSPILLVLLMGSVAEAVGGREVSPERLGQLVHPLVAAGSPELLHPAEEVGCAHPPVGKVALDSHTWKKLNQTGDFAF